MQACSATQALIQQRTKKGKPPFSAAEVLWIRFKAKLHRDTRMKRNTAFVREVEQGIGKAMFDIHKNLEAQQIIFQSGVGEVLLCLFLEFIYKLFYKHGFCSCPGDL